MQGDLKFKGTREEFVAGGLMAELDEPEKGRGPEDSPIEEKTHADSMKPKLANKSLIELQEGEADDGLISSETSSIAPDDEATLSSSTPDLKNKPPRKLIEDERRATGRISSDVWKTYITVCKAQRRQTVRKGMLIIRPWVDHSGVCWIRVNRDGRD